jgi:L-ascorbate metabolism protein UlaG (beta-lactamase superfamily)
MMAASPGRVTWLGHATALIELDGARLVTDPLLRMRTAHLRRVAEPVREPLAAIDAVLVSHVHWDHLDLRSLDRLGRDAHVVVPRGAGALLTRRGFSAVSELEEDEQLQVGDVVIRATHAEHDAARRGAFGARTVSLGYLVEGSKSVYFAGDTDRFEGMARLAPGLDVALLPIAGWGPSLPPGHLDAKRAAEALVLLRPRIAIPIHWATFAPFYRSRPYHLDAGEQFAARARIVAPEVEVRVLSVGESCPL